MAADLARVEAAFLKADQAGDTEAATALAGEVRRLRGAAVPIQKQKPTLWETIKREAAPDIFNTEHAAYELGGKVTDATGSPMAGYLTNVAAQAVPTIVGAFGGSAAAPVMQDAGRGLMKSAIKASAGNLERGKVPQAIETMLKGGYSPTNSGLAAMRSQIAGLTDEADKILAPSKKVIDLSRASQNVASVADKARTATMGARDAGDALTVGRSLLAHPAVDDIGLMSVPAAQAMKQANYKALGDASYGMGLKPAAERDAIKALTAALKENIERAEPAVAPINKKVSDLVNAVKVSQRRALIEGNKDVIPLGASVATALQNPAAALSLYANSSAAVKGLLARMLYSGAKGIPTAAGGAIGGAIGSESGTAPTEAELARALREMQ